MTVFYSSDTHFWHRNIIRYCKRPFSSVEEMNEELIRRWNSVVGTEDTIRYLGDFGFAGVAKLKAIREGLNGTIVFIPGNHDDEKTLRKIKGPHDCIISLAPGEYHVAGGVAMAHYPPTTFDWQAEAEYFLCGHVHELWSRQGNVINVGVDVRDFTPRTLEECIR